MSQKYEFTGETKIEFGVKLRRIRALVAIAAIGVAVGDLGGWIEKEGNLSQVYGNAWVSGNARVSGDARVSGNARVYGDAQVYGDAWVSRLECAIAASCPQLPRLSGQYGGAGCGGDGPNDTMCQSVGA
jgi:hypothetical protein